MLVKHRVDVNCAVCHATCCHLTSSNDQCLVLGMITSFHSKYTILGYHLGRQITSWQERAYHICSFALSRQIVSRICNKQKYIGLNGVFYDGAITILPVNGCSTFERPFPSFLEQTYI